MRENLCELIGAQCGEGYCSACFDGDYPTRVPEQGEKNRFEFKISEGKNA